MLARALATLTLEQLLAEQSACLSAYLKLSRGAATATVTLNTDGTDRTISYTRTELKHLADLLSALDRAIADKAGDTSAQAAQRRRPLHPIL